MPDGDDSKQERRISLNVKSIDGVPFIYSDYVTANIGPFGIKISFGTVDSIQPKEEVRDVTMHSHIGISAEHARSLIELLVRQTALYEEQFGAIRELPHNKGEDPADGKET